ncbi:hypothetical protein EB796_008157 [Bugula neritina]|uniref:Plastocyanin-like domain-containing protein n=1 Tax=Bugula neritina TaxID=10212 RepID=A0A7J7K5L4_BUGNE|nr:hypothetical protein EB796_008157 [Bugula neritina]
MMNENGKRLVKPKNGQLYDIGDLNTPLDNVSDIIQADGYYQNPRLVIVANNSLPGPTISVTEGQKVKVKVINKLLSEGQSFILLYIVSLTIITANVNFVFSEKILKK